ncbi:MAG: purine-nucleoside phosphorylase [Rubrivivax sp.]
MTTPVADLADPIAASATRLRATGCAPRIAVVLGSGWGGLTQRVEGAVEMPYAELPAFPRPTVGGHAARVVLGRIGPHEVALLAGRQHPYEGGRADGMNGALRTLAALGVQTLVLTNAAGSLDPALPPGGLMLISDHLNLPQLSPLWEERDDRRFVDMTDAYDPALRARARAAASEVGVELHEGVYAWMIGPQFETPAEIRMLRTLGVQAVGMSTVPETIVARHAGLRVLGLSMVTNMAAGLGAEQLSHAQTLRQAQAASQRACAALAAIVQDLPTKSASS